MSRKGILRNGAWVKSKFGDLKTLFTLCYNAFAVSGRNQKDPEPEEWYDEGKMKRWSFHASDKSRKHPDVTRYAYCVLDKSDFDTLGRMMPEGFGRDDDDRNRIQKPPNPVRRRGGDNKRRNVENDADTMDLETVLDEATKTDQKITACHMLMQGSRSSAIKRKAEVELIKIAGLDEDEEDDEQ
jgi:hypothetical protein